MRRRLKEVRQEMTFRDRVWSIETKIEYILWSLRNMNSSAASGTGGTDEYHHEALTKAGLPPANTVPRGAFGYVTDGDDEGMVCVVDQAGTGWNAINVLE